MRPTLLLATFAAALALTGSATAGGNPFGVTVVRFAHGTTPAQMRAAVTASGGVVVGDLSAIDALAVVPSSAGFDGRVSSKQSVTNLFADTLIGADRHDGMRAGGHGGDPGDGSSSGLADPWHVLFQWDDDRMNVQSALRRTSGDRSIAVAVIDSGVDANHRELHGVVDKSLGGNFIPCADLKALFGLGYIDRSGLRDCRDGDFEGHGTWVASRIAGALNGFASNGVAPGCQDRLLQGARGRTRRPLDVDPLRSRRRVLRPAHRRREHVDRGLRRSVGSGFRRRLPALHRRRRTTASRAASRSSRPRATPTSA